MPCQVVPLSQQVPSRWMASMTERVLRIVISGFVEEPDEDLVEHDVVEHLGGRNGGESVAESSRMGAASLDQFSDSGTAERANRRVHREAASAA